MNKHFGILAFVVGWKQIILHFLALGIFLKEIEFLIFALTS